MKQDALAHGEERRIMKSYKNIKTLLYYLRTLYNFTWLERYEKVIRATYIFVILITMFSKAILTLQLAIIMLVIHYSNLQKFHFIIYSLTPFPN